MSIEIMKQALTALENPWAAGAEGVADAIIALRSAIKQPRQWQGLTDDEIEEAGHLNVEGERMLPYSFARAIEAKLREKNNG